MVTGASTADVALVLVDARKGLLEQSRRHTFLSRLLGIRQIVVCINKMDLVGYDRARHDAIADEVRAFAERLGDPALHFVPMAALHGDNVVSASERMPWYAGPTLLELLESLPASAPPVEAPLRLPVQYVLRPRSEDYPDFRGYCGQVASGILRRGDEVAVLPSGRATTVTRIETFDGPLEEAWPPMNVTVHLAEDLDVSRGDMLARPEASPTVGQALRAVLCWMSARPPRPRPTYLLKHTTRTVKAILQRVEARYDVDTLALHGDPPPLALNDVAIVHLWAASPLPWDPYTRGRATGSFVLIDEATNETVAGGMLLGEGEAPLGGVRTRGSACT